MTPAERAVLATSEARDLCLSLRRAFIGSRALARLQAGETAGLQADELRIAVGLAWAAGDIALVRAALTGLPPERVDDDPVLAALSEATQGPGYGDSEASITARSATPRR